MSDNSNNTGTVITACLLGGIIGAALGILFAPSSGKATRKKLNEWIDETADKTRDGFDKVQDELRHKKDQLVQAVTKHL